MYLTKEEEKILSGEYGLEYQKAMKALVKLGDALEAERLIRIVHAHISGISYSNIGDAGLEFLEEICKAKVKVFSTCNPAGFDLEKWFEMGVSKQFYKKQQRIIDALRNMGVQITCTCTPYYIRKPNYREHLAWGESSAVLYANSFYGARTNREGGPTSLFAALIGKTPYVGMHIEKYRAPRVLIRVETPINDQSYASTLGYIIGERSNNEIPYVEDLNNLNGDLVKAVCAGAGTSSSLALILFENVSPEAKNYSETKKHLEKIYIEKKDIEEYMSKYEDQGPYDIVFLGCPHLSYNEIIKIYHYVQKVQRKTRIPIFLAASRDVFKKIPLKVFYSLQRSNIRLFKDTCLVVAPLLEMNVRSVITNSIKHAYYLKNIHKVKVKMCNTLECVRIAFEGT